MDCRVENRLNSRECRRGVAIELLQWVLDAPETKYRRPCRVHRRTNRRPPPPRGFAALLSVNRIDAQEVTCRLLRQPDLSYVGACVRGVDTVVSSLQLRRARSDSAVMRGSGLVNGRPLPMGLDARTGGTFRGSGWLDLDTFAEDSVAMQVSFRLNELAVATDVDVAILRRAKSYLGDSASWTPSDDQPLWIAALAKAMPSNADLGALFKALTGIASDSAIALGRSLAAAPSCPGQARTLFCALHSASVVETGEYWDDSRRGHATPHARGECRRPAGPGAAGHGGGRHAATRPTAGGGAVGAVPELEKSREALDSSTSPAEGGRVAVLQHVVLGFHVAMENAVRCA
jgi:hypothetical protein